MQPFPISFYFKILFKIIIFDIHCGLCNILYLLTKFRISNIEGNVTDEGDGDEEAAEGGTGEGKKKRKRNRKKKTGGGGGGGASQPTDPPSVAIEDLYPNKNFPIGQIMDYPDVEQDG